MGEDSLNRIDGDSASFLHREWFYILVVAAVFVLGAFQTYHMFYSDTSSVDLAPPVTVSMQEFRRELFRKTMAEQGSAKAVPELVVNGIRLAGLFAGLSVIGLAILGKLVWKPKPPLPFGRPPWGLWDVLKVAAVWAIGSALFSIIFRVDESDPLGNRNGWVADGFSRILLIGTILYVALREKNGSLRDLGVRGPVGWALALGLIGFLFTRPLLTWIEVAMYWAITPWPMSQAFQTMIYTDSSNLLAFACVLSIILTPVTEELFFRGFLQNALQRWLGGWGAITVGAAFFSLAHMDIYAVPSMFVLGLALGYVYYRSRSLAAPLLIHVLHNAVVVFSALGARIVLQT